MKNIYAVVIAFFSFIMTVQGQEPCVPDSTVGDTVGIYPPTLAEGAVGQAYSQLINIVVPEVFATPLGSASICSFRVDSIPNLPEGLSYTCNVDGCSFVVDHKDTVTITRACAVLEGTPLSAVLPDDTLRVYASVVAGLLNGTNDCVPFPAGLIPPELTTVVFPVALKLSGNTAIGDFSTESFSLKVFPNPSDGNSRITFNLPERAKVQVDLIDLIGRKMRTVIQGQYPAGEVSQEIESSDLTSGIYFLRVSLDEGEKVITRKWVLRK